jgi:hypothetical protein
MVTFSRSSRGLTREQVRCILAWDARWRQFRATQGTAASLAQGLGVGPHVVYYCLTRAASERVKPGRPALLSPREIKAVLAWRRRFERFLVRHGRARDLAAKLGTCRNAIYECIRRHRATQSTSTSKLRGSPEASPQRGPRRRPMVTDDVRRSRLLRRWGASRGERNRPPSRNRVTGPRRVREKEFD